MYGLFFQEKNGGLKVTIKDKIKYNLLPESLQTLATINLIDNTNIFNRRLSFEFNSLYVIKLFMNAHQNG